MTSLQHHWQVLGLRPQNPLNFRLVSDCNLSTKKNVVSVHHWGYSYPVVETWDPLVFHSPGDTLRLQFYAWGTSDYNYWEVQKNHGLIVILCKIMLYHLMSCYIPKFQGWITAFPPVWCRRKPSATALQEAEALLREAESLLRRGGTVKEVEEVVVETSTSGGFHHDLTMVEPQKLGIWIVSNSMVVKT